MAPNISRIISNMARIEPISTKREANSQISGLHLVSMYLGPDQEDPQRIIDTPVGDVKSPYGGPEGVAFYATLKAAFAYSAHQKDPSIITSHQIAEPENFLYGGAVVFPGNITISASGYHDARDALSVTRGGLLSGLCDESYASKIVGIIAEHAPDFDVEQEWKALQKIRQS